MKEAWFLNAGETSVMIKTEPSNVIRCAKERTDEGVFSRVPRVRAGCAAPGEWATVG
jgi:hypothetical protein